ncbi:MAG: toxin-antitoxin system YwqK family antitoxin [Planctomycetes bacterium]|nr:toxin-antitoxin system YwqK family antitoxin [Planctomycetota bacterium]
MPTRYIARGVISGVPALALVLMLAFVPIQATTQDAPTTDKVSPILEERCVPSDGSIADGTLLERYTVMVVDGKDVKHGHYQRWRAHPYTLVEDSWYFQGELHGPSLRITYSDEASKFDNFVQRVKCDYVGGKPSGTRVLYLNGLLLKEQHYFDGERHGIQREYHENGRLSSESSYDHGRPVGSARAWEPDGQLRTEFNYKNGRPDGTWRTWGPNYLLEHIEHYKDGKLDGEERCWYASGRLMFVKVWKDGKEVSAEHYRDKDPSEDHGKSDPKDK